MSGSTRLLQYLFFIYMDKKNTNSTNNNIKYGGIKSNSLKDKTAAIRVSESDYGHVFASKRARVWMGCWQA